MAVASRSHVRSPYYVIIKSVGKDFIETEIPGHNSLKITGDDGRGPSLGNWDYHIPRMSLIGSGPGVEKLLYNQKNLVPEKPTSFIKKMFQSI